MAVFELKPAQRDAIFASGKSIAVSAAAGSGKTFVLTRRIIEKLLSPEGDLSRMLVVTFTKAAASELISRISDALSDELAKQPTNAHLRKQSMIVSSAKICTIDSFCYDLVRENFQLLGLSPDVSAADDGEMALLQSQLLDELISDYFDGNVTGENAIDDFSWFADSLGSPTDTEDLGKTLLGIYGKLTSTADFLETLRVCRDAYACGAESPEESPWYRAALAHLRSFLTHYEAIYRAAVDRIAGSDAYSAKHQAVYSEEADAVTALLRSLDDASHDALAAGLCGFCFGSLIGARVRDDAEKAEYEIYKNARNEFKEGLKAYQSLFGVSADTLRQEMRLSAVLTEGIYHFLREFDARFEAEKRRRHVLSFSDMERMALTLLQDETGAPSALAVSLRDGYDELFIDEYQDTNGVQDRIFRLISRPDNLFRVGDLKQSIYSFRDADPSLFQEVLSLSPTYREDGDGKDAKIYLSANFRSTEEILEFCNGIFGEVMRFGSLRYGEEERLVCGSDKHGALPEVVLLEKSSGTDDTDEEDAPADEPEYLASRIETMLLTEQKADGTRIRPSDIAVLFRSMTSASAYTEALKRHGIPFHLAEDKTFFESREVLLVFSLLNTIDNPTRDIDLAASLKSPLFGVTIGELLYLRRYAKAHAGEIGTSLFDALKAFTEETSFAKGEKFLTLLASFRALARELPSDQLIWQLYEETGIFSLLSGAEGKPLYEIEAERANLIRLYHYARTFERGGFRGLSAFLGFVNELLTKGSKIDVSQFASPGEAVRLMTVHKSKGLEFPVCFLCNAQKNFNFEDLKSRVLFEGTLGVASRIASADGAKLYDTFSREVEKTEIRYRQVEEEMRLLYVALTRAKERLIVLASLPENKRMEMAQAYQNGERISGASPFASEETVLGISSWLPWILTGVDAHPERCRVIFPTDERVPTLPAEHEQSPTDTSTMTRVEADALVRERLDYEYPFRASAKIPSKLSVSVLYPGVLDDRDEPDRSSGAEKPIAIPAFLREEPDEDVTAAERGTAMHTFMQFFEFDSVAERGIEGEIRRLAEEKFIFPSDVDRMDVRKLKRFFESPIADAMRRAKHIYREKRFLIRYPAALFTEREDEALADETLLVQGIIDCAFFDETGDLILLDYKTDHFSRSTPRAEIEQTLTERHARQLGYYQLACEKIFGCAPSRTLIYSFALDDTVELPLQYHLGGDNS